MRVGHDVTVAIHNHPRADGMLASDQRGLSLIAFLDCYKASDENLDHGWGNFGYQLCQRGIELLQSLRSFGGTRTHRLSYLGHRVCLLRNTRLRRRCGGGLLCRLLSRARRQKKKNRRDRESRENKTREFCACTRWNEHRISSLKQ